MKDFSVVYPVLVLVALTFIVMGLMAKARFDAYRTGQLKVGEPGMRPVWLGWAGNVSNCYHNLLEMPVLFYAAVAFALITDAVDWEMVWLAWAYVIFRVAQALIHVTYNSIAHRFIAFLLSNVVLIAMWVNIALWLFFGL
jgi:hypothetical protein